jgi:hypothetical protein
VQFQLADIPLLNGILRIDKNISTEPVEVRLGHYALPKLNGPIKTETRKVKGHDVRIIDNGTYQLAMVSLSGWDDMKTIATKGVHPESNESAVINVSDNYSPGKDSIYGTLMLWKRSGEKWDRKELVPIKKIRSSKDGKLAISFFHERSKVVKF